MRKAFTPKKLLHYTLMVTVVWMAYRFYVSYQNLQQEVRRYRAYGPRDLGPKARRDNYNNNDDDTAAVGPKDLDDRLRQLHHNNIDDSDSDLRRRQPDEENKNDNYKRQAEEERKLPDEAQEREGEPRANAVERADDDAESGKRGGGREGEGGGGGGGGRREEKWEREERAPLHHNDIVKPKGPHKDEVFKDTFKVDEKVDWVLEEELQQRRKKFLEDVASRAEEYNPEYFKNMIEKDDHLAFVTTARDRTFAAVLQFVHSVQYFYPGSEIGVFDLGLSGEKRRELESYCMVSVIPTYMQFWPEHLRDANKTLWRPMIWQMGLSAFGHMVYVEPGRFLHTKNMKDYIEHSRRHGVTVVGRKLKYSPFVVTHPEMFFFLSVDTRKLQRVMMFDLTMLVLHNSEPVRHELMRHLVSCAIEEYCIAPPGSRPECDTQRLYAGSKRYANCHRYEMSALNLILGNWFRFQLDEYLVRDIATAHYTGQNARGKLKICKPVVKENEEI